MATNAQPLPPLPYDEWEDTKATLHLVAQILGKIKLANHPKAGHWWHATLHVTPRGISTQTIPTPTGNFEIEIDVRDLHLKLWSSQGGSETVALADRSVKDIYSDTMTALERIGHPTRILAKPYDMPHSTTSFGEDDQHRSWNKEAIQNWWRAITFVDEVFKTFGGRSFTRTSPIHLFWHSFDYVVTRFSGNTAPNFGSGDRRSDVEAYSHEVISFGFWPGDPKTRFPAFYSYTAPEPEGLADQPLAPASAWWQELPGSHLALLKYDDLRSLDDPRQGLLDFMNSAYLAGCSCARWSGFEKEETSPFWDQLDERFPRTRGREKR